MRSSSSWAWVNHAPISYVLGITVYTSITKAILTIIYSFVGDLVIYGIWSTVSLNKY